MRLAFPFYVIGLGVAILGATGLVPGVVWADIGVLVLGLAIFSVGLYVEEKSIR